MSEFGKIEKHIASLLVGHPKIKNRLKLAYQKINHTVYGKPYTFKLAKGVYMKRLLESNDLGDFWGYYDSSPILEQNFLTHSFNHMERESSFTTQLDILVNGSKVSETNAWNWQQGSRLFWIDTDTIVHNVYIHDSYKSKILYLKTGKQRFLDTPIYAYHRKSKVALGLNFKRLGRLDPAYGYFAHEKDEVSQFDDQEDGIFKIDTAKNIKELIISFDTLKTFHAKPHMHKAIHGINHIQISPSANRFMFLHRTYLGNGQKFSRLISADLDGSNLHLLSDDDMVSHCNWKNDHEIIGWMHKNKSGDGYYLHKDQTNHFEQLGSGILKEDGHPSFSACGKYMITDTYPDRSRMSHVLLYDLIKKRLSVIGSFYTPIQFNNEKRCDLHPRFSDDGNISIDSVHEGVRHQVQLDISKIL